MSSTRERDAFPKTLSRCTRLMFSSTEASTSQWESSVFVSPIKAPALMILDVYGAEDAKPLLRFACAGWHIFQIPFFLSLLPTDFRFSKPNTQSRQVGAHALYRHSLNFSVYPCKRRRGRGQAAAFTSRA